MRVKLTTVILAVIIINSACSKSAERMVGKPLTEEEMAIPAGRYQAGVDMWNRARVRMSSPQAEPVLEWQEELPFLGDTTTAFVDREGGVWYRTGSQLLHTNTIVRLNPDGTVDWQRDLNPPFSSACSIAEPMVVLDGAVVCLNTFIPIDLANETPSSLNSTGTPIEFTYLECIDFDGNTRWRTDTFASDATTHMAWRLPDNRIAVSGYEETVFIFSLEDGELLESILIFGWSAHQTVGPLPTPDGGFITYGSNRETEEDLPYIARYAPNGTKQWGLGWPQYSFALPPSLSEEGLLLFGNGDGLWGIGIEDGSILWSHVNGFSQHALGVTYDGNLLSMGWDSGEGPPDLKLCNPSGSIIWSMELTWGLSYGESQVIIYEDNSVLIGYRYGFSMLNHDGTIRWTVDSNDLGFISATDFSHWKFNPKQDGGLVAYVVERSEGWHDRILGFKPG